MKRKAQISTNAITLMHDLIASKGKGKQKCGPSKKKDRVLDGYGVYISPESGNNFYKVYYFIDCFYYM